MLILSPKLTAIARGRPLRRPRREPDGDDLTLPRRADRRTPGPGATRGVERETVELVQPPIVAVEEPTGEPAERGDLTGVGIDGLLARLGMGIGLVVASAAPLAALWCFLSVALGRAQGRRAPAGETATVEGASAQP